VSPPSARPSAPPRVLDNPSYRWYLAGGIVSMLGDQFTLIALPWLVLRMTGDPALVGLTLGLIGVPRVVFILFGGAIVDRYSPKSVLMQTKYVSVALLVVLVALLLTGTLKLWMVFALAAGMGLATAFSMPAMTSIMPSIVRLDQLMPANGIMMSARQFSVFAGPLLAGLVIWSFGTAQRGTVIDSAGLAAAFGFDAFTFALSAWTLRKVQTRAPAAPPGAPPAGPPVGVVQAVMAGLRTCWNDVPMRSYFFYLMSITALVAGPMQVALPTLASQFGSAAGYGSMMGAYGAGALCGTIVAGARPGLRIGTLGMTLLLLDFVAAIVIAPVGHMGSAWQAMGLLFLNGTLLGFAQLSAFTWVQRRTPRPMLGRVMSLYSAIGLGMPPLAAALAGMVIKRYPIDAVFLTIGLLMLVLVALAFFFTPVRRMQDMPPQPMGPPGAAPAGPAGTAAPVSQPVVASAGPAAVSCKQPFTREQIVGFLREAEAGANVAELCVRHGFTEQRFEGWRAKMRGMRVNDALRMRALENDVAQLKQLLGGAMLELERCRERGAAGPAVRDVSEPHDAPSGRRDTLH
jgi:MFS family permease